MASSFLILPEGVKFMSSSERLMSSENVVLEIQFDDMYQTNLNLKLLENTLNLIKSTHLISEKKTPNNSSYLGKMLWMISL